MLTIDLVFRCLTFTILNPTIVALWPLSMLISEVYSAYDLTFRLIVLYAILVFLVHGLLYLDHVYRQSIHGPKRRLDWSSELVLVTGGASGLGQSIVSLLASRRTRIAVLDIIQTNENAFPGTTIRSYVCDVSSQDDLSRTYRKLESDFGQCPTIVVSCAGIMKLGTIQGMSMIDIDRILGVNLRSHFLLAKEYLPSLLKTGGHIITVSSALGSVGVHSLAAYCASKAATTSFHESLTAEVAGTGIVTTLISPGQLNSKMFSSVTTPNSFFAPVISTYEVANFIVDKIERREGGIFAMPLYARFIGIMRVLPSGLQVMLRWLSGMDQAAAGPG